MNYVNGLNCLISLTLCFGPKNAFMYTVYFILSKVRLYVIQEPNQLPLLVALVENSDLAVNLLHYAMTLLDENYEMPITHAEGTALACQIIKKEKRVLAGSLVLAKDTVCFLGELTKYKKDALDCIKSGTFMQQHLSRCNFDRL